MTKSNGRMSGAAEETTSKKLLKIMEALPESMTDDEISVVLLMICKVYIQDPANIMELLTALIFSCGRGAGFLDQVTMHCLILSAEHEMEQG
jgi:hypothetical protein